MVGHLTTYWPILTSLDTRRAEPADVAAPFHIRRKVVKVCGLVPFARFLRPFVPLIEIYRLVPFSTPRYYGVPVYTSPTSGWTPLTVARDQAKARQA